MTATATATQTVNHLFVERFQTMPDTVAIKFKEGGTWVDRSWKDYFDASRKIGLGFRKLGLEPGQGVAILSNTRPEWAYADLGILCVRGITVPIYQSNLPDEVKYILDDSKASFLLMEDLDQWKKCHGMLDQLDAIKTFVVIDTQDTETTKAADVPFPEGDRVITLEALYEIGAGEDEAEFIRLAQEATPEDTATFIYTSGTTGNPKGVVLTHKNALGECEALHGAISIGPQDMTLAFLPLAHVFARALHWYQLRAGFVTSFAESIAKVVDNMGEVRPTLFAAVPRVYEKLHAAVMAKILANPPLKRKIALMGLTAAMERVEAENAGRSPSLGCKIRGMLGSPGFSKVKAGLQARTGGRIRYMVSGGAPLSPEIAYFLTACGLPIFEGYGLTETTAATHINRPGACRLGTVGQVVTGVECKIAPDGEVLVRGDVIMKEYFNRPDATAETIKDGWFYTGDIGEIDGDGFLKITDRKKDLIITAAGKNVAPQNVENHVKTHPLISQIAMFGDRKKFCVALITVDPDAGLKALTDAGIQPPATAAEVAKHPKIFELMTAAITEKNQKLPSYETIKYFEILEHDFVVGEELTPTLKVKRKKVAEKYATEIAKLYSDNGG
ncbi:MAG: long-chain fatty acid--CoA ligase [Planctomycetes bacterium]|nr:long-chain fatty acid--CoA ligase [Planctomycetota bacterium]